MVILAPLPPFSWLPYVPGCRRRVPAICPPFGQRGGGPPPGVHFGQRRNPTAVPRVGGASDPQAAGIRARAWNVMPQGLEAPWKRPGSVSGGSPNRVGGPVDRIIQGAREHGPPAAGRTGRPRLRKLALGRFDQGWIAVPQGLEGPRKGPRSVP